MSKSDHISVGSALVVSCAVAAAVTLIPFLLVQWDHARRPLYHTPREFVEYKALNFSALFWWLYCPTTTLIFLWVLALQTGAVLRHTPALFSSYAQAAIGKMLPVHPRSLADAFALGRAYEAAEFSPDALYFKHLQALEKIAGRRVTVDEVRGLPEAIHELDNRRGLISHVVSCFSIINLIWFVATIGLTITTGPFLWLLLSPFRLFLWDLWVFVILPWLIWLRPAYEPFFYAASGFAAIESARYPCNDHYSRAGVLTAFTAFCIFIGSWQYTTLLNSAEGGDAISYVLLSNTLMITCAASFAILHNSELFGYITVCLALFLFNFHIFSTELALLIGVSGSLENVAASCFVFTVLNAVLKCLDIRPRWMEPFSAGISVIGSSAFFLVLDMLVVISAAPVSVSNGVMIVMLVGYLCMGEFAGLVGMSNVAKVWGGIYLFTKYCQHLPLRGDAFTVGIFFLFFMMYIAALFLNRHPELVKSLFE